MMLLEIPGSHCCKEKRELQTEKIERLSKNLADHLPCLHGKYPEKKRNLIIRWSNSPILRVGTD